MAGRRSPTPNKNQITLWWGQIPSSCGSQPYLDEAQEQWGQQGGPILNWDVPEMLQPPGVPKGHQKKDQKELRVFRFQPTVSVNNLVQQFPLYCTR